MPPPIRFHHENAPKILLGVSGQPDHHALGPPGEPAPRENHAPALAEIAVPPFYLPDEGLLEWLRQPRLRLLDLEDHQTAVFVWAMLNRKTVGFV